MTTFTARIVWKHLYMYQFGAVATSSAEWRLTVSDGDLITAMNNDLPLHISTDDV